MEPLRIKNYLLIRGLESGNYQLDKFIKVVIDSGTVLFYQGSSLSSYSFFCTISGDYILKCENAFYPVFYHKSKQLIAITPDYSLLNVLNLPLDINYTAIKEFVVFNTPLKTGSFNNIVERLFGIREITINHADINISYIKENIERSSLLNTFGNNIKGIINNTFSDKHGVFLSGGNESRINAAISNHYNLDRNFITWGHPEDIEFIIASKIAKEKKIGHINIRPVAADLPYREYLEKTGYLSNMQYAYRYQSVKSVYEQYAFNHLWTGWGEVNGFIKENSPTEFFNQAFWDYIKLQTINNSFWSKDFLLSTKLNSLEVLQKRDKREFLYILFRFFQKEIAPRIYGQVLSAESTICNIIAPWFDRKIYESIFHQQERNSNLFLSRSSRVKWKNNIYTNLLNKYDPALNNFKNSKNYYPFLFSDSLKHIGLPIAYLLTKTSKKRQRFFDPMENTEFMKRELENCLESRRMIFNNIGILKAINNSYKWTGPEILELFKIIQINLFLSLHDK